MKYPKNTRAGMARRRQNRKQFNTFTGLPHTLACLERVRACGMGRSRRFTYATAARTGGIK